ncbi:FYN-binding protein 1 isoform X3 [Pelodiscus sinensis]|uniref:FYN-binding protein 1 isoform X3 n=2 Tax=Pelodiscus sinensis TaxID=13735 RepID=UPI0003C49778|nr:FYN-binding protein 1 isoform X1 [Pelodiscus sinensis]|eukprot:XP_006139542.1 FYN-binding protein 1 isoform X1 [Pelodiscus sinensis]
MQAGKADVKALMAKFNAGNHPSEDVSVSSQPFKIPGHLSASGLQARKAALEKFANPGNASSPSGSSIHKSASPKPSFGVKPSTEDKTEKDPKPPYLKPKKLDSPLNAANKEADGKSGFPKYMGPKPHELPKEDSKPVFPKPAVNKFHNSTTQENDTKPLGLKPNFNSAPQESGPKPAFSKVAGFKEKFIAASQENDPKPPFPKPPVGLKHSGSPDVSHHEDISSRAALFTKGSSGSLGPRPKIQSFKLPREAAENSSNGTDAPAGRFPSVTLKSVGNRSSPGQVPKNVEEKTEDNRPGIAKKISLNKINQEDSGPTPPKFPKPPAKLAAGGPSRSFKEREEGDKSSATPKHKALTPLFKLGPPPQKPSRPPTVDLERFRKNSARDSSNKETVKQKVSHTVLSSPLSPPSHSATQIPPPPPPSASHPSTQAQPVPSLPPRNIKPNTEPLSLENEQSYDDVEFGADGRGNTDGDQESEGETYEDINDMRATSKEEEKKKEKEEKRRLDQEKKEQREKEKKEQEIRKKFKLSGPIQVIHQARACMDYKGGKNEMTVKQGDKIEIIRITDNPEGKWLGRTTKGCYGYIKTTVVEIDYDSLKRKQRPSMSISLKHVDSDQEVYDDVGDQDSNSSHSGGRSGTGMMFPPPPADEEIYDGIDDEDANARSISQDEDKNDSWSRGLLKMLKGKDDKKKSVREKTTKVNEAEDNGGSFMNPPVKQFGKDAGDNDVYDDVESSDFPPPPIEIESALNIKSLGLGRGKSDEKDSRKLKKMEKEEKDFRKKFKFEGEIKVIYSTTIILDLQSKKWGAKDLQVKPGESVDILQITDDAKVLCRNEEGKYGYVLRSNLVENDGEIYDDIADGCIYDND